VEEREFPRRQQLFGKGINLDSEGKSMINSAGVGKGTCRSWERISRLRWQGALLLAEGKGYRKE